MKTKAAVLHQLNNPLVIEELLIPELKEGQVLVQLKTSGICHTQLNEIKGKKGPDKFLPHTLGHEGSGVVYEIGEKVSKVKKGDHVVLSWIKGLGGDVPSAHYQNSRGVVNSGAISTFMEYAVVSENRVVKVVPEMPFDVASLLGCAVPTGAGIIKNTLHPEKGTTLVIFGIGGVGSSALLFAGTMGFQKVIGVDINEQKLKRAKELGATDTVNSKVEDAVARVKAITGAGADYSIECSGAREAMESAFACLKNRGTAVIAGNLRQDERITINPFDLIAGKKIIGTWGGETKPDSDIPFYADLFLAGRLKLEKLITHRFRLDNINEAFLSMERGEIGRAIIEF